ncbi:carboxypeptidase-like regulatory domain-containing protein [Spirosoma litoris]
MRFFIAVVLFVSICLDSYAQTGTISGRVVDAKTLEPLPFTNVYVNNTTMGVVTNASGEFVLHNLPLGTADIVFSFIGYISQQVKVTVKATGNSPMAIQLMADAQQVAEVNVKAGRDKAWEKQLKRFEKVFLGNTSDCKLLNPWAIDFIDEKGNTTAKASIPLEIDNRRLGYKLFFQLKSATYSTTEYSIVGTTRFSELETTSATEARHWTKEREQAYQGSAKHLMKSILDRKLSLFGFGLYRDKGKAKPRTKSFTFELEHNLAPVDTTSLVTSGSGMNEYRIVLKERVEVHYRKEFIYPSFYADVSDAVSWLEVRGGYVLINKEGTILNPTDVAISGNMTDARLSGMLPLDYKPGDIVIAQKPINHSARRLQEKVYLHTDKPYYYPGDKLWFSAYMTYRLPELIDTLSRVLYVDLIDANRVVSQSRVLPLDSGRAASSFRLPVTVPPGKYVLRAYTQWMKNYGIDHFFYKPIVILALNQRVDEKTPKPVSDSLLKIVVDKSVYPTRSQVKMTLRLDTTESAGVMAGSFSVAVLDEADALSNAELGTIKKGADFLEPPRDMPLVYDYPIEKGITLDGIYSDKKGKAKKTTLTLLPEDLSHIYQATTHNDGAFSLANLAFYDSTKFFMQSPEGSIQVVAKESPRLPEKLPDLPLHIVSSTTLHAIAAADTLQGKRLAEVKVSAKKIIQSENSYGQADVTIKGESIEGFATIADAIASKLPSFILVYDQTDWYLIWARASTPNSRDLSAQKPNIASKNNLSAHEPNLYINNVLVVGETAGSRLMQLSPTLIDHIEINGMITSNQGASGSNGLINVYTKRPSDEAKSKGLPFGKVRGFDRESTFRSPDYTYQSTTSDTKDYRSTLYWNPKVKVSVTQRPVELTFFTSDQPGTYRIVVEGITNNGTPVHAETTFVINE